MELSRRREGVSDDLMQRQPSGHDSRSPASDFDPLRSEGRPALMDDTDDEGEHEIVFTESTGMLEMEDDVVSVAFEPVEEPVRTTSGLLLTHRKTPQHIPRATRDFHTSDYKKNPPMSGVSQSPMLPRSSEKFEVQWRSGNNDKRSFVAQAQSILRYVRAWVWLSAIVLALGTIVLVHHVRHGQVGQTKRSSAAVVADRVVLLPLPETQSRNGRRLADNFHLAPLPDEAVVLRASFDEWVTRHGKTYESHSEKEYRFQVWRDNHHRTNEKNERHGPCRMTKQPVFGDNAFKDLTKDEFRQKYLTGYTGPHTDQLSQRRLRNLKPMPTTSTPRHAEVHRRVQEQWRRSGPIGRRGVRGWRSCPWYDVSCMLQYIFETYFYGLGATMEPAYDSKSYPKSIDWRDIGAVSEIHSQGKCGACWAITAVETIESAVFISSGIMYDLSETEVIVCQDECELCYGGWPQEAFEYVMDNKGLPLDEDVSYDGDTLLAITQSVISEEGGDKNEDALKTYQQDVCPDKNNKEFSRYGKIEGYGYATERCVCYTDGSGCDCDSQNEGMAVRNVATHGPAVVCVDAAEWQDYAGGIITSESGCSQKFLDVNHCVQVVGYAYDSDNDEGQEGGSRDKSGSGDAKSGSGDRENRQGYWIVRNQWSTYWGYNGYAYVAMGENTCGILNDMIQVYV